MPKAAHQETPEKLPDNAVKQRLAATLSELNKQFGPNTVSKLGERPKLDVPSLSTGDIGLDTALGVGGLPYGRIIEIYGPESGGKTTLALTAIGQYQKLNTGRATAFIDVEHALNLGWAQRLGVNTDELLFSQPDSGEDALNIMEGLIKSDAVGIIVLDSVAALITKAELDGQMGDVTMGSQARLMSQAMRRLTAVVSKSNCICIFINQIREKIGVMFGSPETTSGGRALKFFSSIRLDVRRKDAIKEPDGTIIGNRVKVKVVKNKVAPPFKETEFDLLYASGISKEGTLIDLGLETKVLEKRGAWISYNGNLIGQGRDATRITLSEKPELFKEIYDKALAKLLKVDVKEAKESTEAKA